MAKSDRHNGSTLKLKKVIFIADFFKEQITGGAEINDDTLIQWLKSEDLLHEKINSQFVTPDYITDNLDKVFVISNFTKIPPESFSYFALGEYVVYEHDYKFVSSRNPVKYVDFKVPENEIINYNFYKNAKAVVCLSKMHREIFEKNIDLKNLFNINCSLYDDKKIDLLLSLSTHKKTKKYAIIKTNNPTKRMPDTIEWCKKQGLEYDLISHKDNNEFLKILSQYENLVFMTAHPEPTPRIAVESKLMGVNLIASKQLIGVAHEYWWNWRPEKIAKELKQIRENTFTMFREFLNE